MTSVEEKKEISEETSEKTVSEETQGITLNDIVAMRNIVNIASRRGAFGADEFKDIGIIYNRIDTFEEEGLINNKRFAEQYIYSRSQKGYGPFRIEQELKQRGINESD